MQISNGRLIYSPSDITAYQACEHLSSLSLQVARGGLAKPPFDNEQAELVFRKGREHEDAYLQRLKREHDSVAEISLAPDLDWERAARETIAAMRAGAGVVYQAVLVGDDWRGVADFLTRVEAPSDLGDWSYEALDTKLARHAKPAYILQLCFYTERIAAIQRRTPAHIHVLLGNLEQATFRPDDFAAYYRRVCRRLENFLGDPPATEPLPCPQCEICKFKPVCDAHWDAVDHLSRVAGIQGRQVQRLREGGLRTLALLASAPPDIAPPAGIATDTYDKLRQQAALQLTARETGSDSYVVLPPRADSGLALLPDPSSGDLFLDFEGNPFWDADGSLEYLWGILDADDHFTPIFAWDHDTERVAFERFVDLVHERLDSDRAMHVYHYAQYEITALRRLMGRYGTREAEFDDLLRRDVFVDLFKVVRGGLRVSRPGYGLKEMEAFLGFERNAAIRDGAASIVAFEEWMTTREQRILDEIAEYNQEDCIATRLLRDWLLKRRTEALAAFGPFPSPADVEPKPMADQTVTRAKLRLDLIATGEPGCGLAAQLLDYHDRERKPVWWAFFDRVEMSPLELVDDADSIGALQKRGKAESVKRSWIHTFAFPAQEHKLRAGAQPFDPATRRNAGTIVELDRDTRHVKLKRGPSLEATPLPDALIPGRPLDTDAQEAALERIGRSLLAGTRRYPALESVLRRAPFARPVQTNDLDEMNALLLSLDGQYLVVQGPPGSGKTWTSGRLIAFLIDAGKSVGVASTSHKAIHQLLAEVEDAANELGVRFHGQKKASAGNPESEYNGARIANVYSNEDCSDDLLAGTAWLFSDERLDKELDYLFIDEAGQVSLADALAMGTAARNLVLVGDPQQLDQVIQGFHPGGSDASVLKHLIGDVQTIPPDRGIFLERTFRLHPDVCRFISEEFYEGRLRPDPVTSTRTTPLGTGLRWIAVEHQGRRQESAEEAEAVLDEVKRLIAGGIPAPDIKVVAPYNAHVELLRSVLPIGIEVGTVDKFQGQQARVVLYSMASSSGEDVPRGLEFLLSRNRFNVAISRAQCLVYLVCSPQLLEVNCKTIEHMRLANSLCRFAELAKPICSP